MGSTEDMARAAEAFRTRATRGDFSGGNALLAALASALATGSPLVRAWEQVVRAQIWLAFPRAVPAPTAEEVERLADAPPDVRRAAALAARDLTRAAFLAFDWSELKRWTALLGRLACDEVGHIDFTLARALERLALGDGAAPSDVDGILPHASRAGHAAAVVEVQAIRALLALQAGDHQAGLEHARRSSLMARSEAIPEAEFLAGLVLMRARRYNRQVHVALRIADALASAATAPWRPWLAWEVALAGAGGEIGSASAGPHGDLARLVQAAGRGDWQTFRDLVRRLSIVVGGAGLFGQEAADLAGALAPELDARGDEVRAWRLGDVDLVPPALHGLALEMGREASAGPPTAAYVLLRPGERGLRFLGRSMPLVLAREQGAGSASADVARLRPSRRAEGRMETLLAVLALAGPQGLTESECFARAYGFTYVADIHRGVFDVLVHRARAAAEGVARLERKGGRIALLAERRLVLPDPRICQRMADRVLRLLARQGQASAKQAAAELGVSLRAVQGALNELAGRHACVINRQGRHVSYAVEDTVFSKLTLRLDAAQLAHPQGVGSGQKRAQ
jgi:hypothetical protein